MGIGKALVVAALGVLMAYTVMLLRFLNIGQVTWDHQPGPCHFVKGIEYGSEDFEILPDNTALITSGCRTEKIQALRPHVRGQVFLFDFEQPQNEALPVRINPGSLDMESFNPAGIHSYFNKDGATLVYIISYPIGGDEQGRVEKFKWNTTDKTLTHMRSISDPQIRSPNNLVVTGEDSFYLTNFYHSSTDLGQTLELFSFRKWATVVYYDGQKAEVVADGLSGANGIAMTPDGRYFYLSVFFLKELHIFRRHRNNSLELRNIIPLNSSPDNIQLEPETGHIWIGCSPVIWRLFAHEDNCETPAPSQVLRLKLDGDKLVQLEEIFSDSGRHIFGSSVAGYRKDGLLIGTVCHKTFYCEMKYLTAN